MVYDIFLPLYSVLYGNVHGIFLCFLAILLLLQYNDLANKITVPEKKKQQQISRFWEKKANDKLSILW